MRHGEGQHVTEQPTAVRRVLGRAACGGQVTPAAGSMRWVPPVEVL